MDASFYSDKNMKNRVIHTDMHSMSTSPTWGDLKPNKNIMLEVTNRIKERWI